MAGNISDDGSAPVDFNLSSTIEDEDKVSSLRKKCMLCNSLKKTFYCKICVRNGDFVSSTPQHPGIYFSYSRANDLPIILFFVVSIIIKKVLLKFYQLNKFTFCCMTTD